MGGGDERNEICFIPQFAEFLDAYRMTVGPWMRSHRPRLKLDPQCTTSSQSEIGRPVTLINSILCGEISILAISVFVPESSGLWKYVWIDNDSGIRCYRPQMTVLYVRSRANDRPAIRQKGRTRYDVFFFICLKLEPGIPN